MVAPYASCAWAAQGSNAACEHMESGAAAKGRRPARPSARAGAGERGSWRRSCQTAGRLPEEWLGEEVWRRRMEGN